MRQETPQVTARSLLHRQLTHALLLECVRGCFEAGQRFFSSRRIRQLWEVSDSTAKTSLACLVDQRVLEVRPRSGYYLTPWFRERALLILHKRSCPPLPSSARWETARFGFTSTVGRRKRLALIQGEVLHPPATGRQSVLERVGMEWCRAFREEASSAGCDVFFYANTGLEENDRETINAIAASQTDGVAVFLRNLSNSMTPLIETIAKRNIPAVRVFGGSLYTHVPTVNVNNVAIGYEAAIRLLRQGHRNFALITGLPEQEYFSERIEGFCHALDEWREKTRATVIKLAFGKTPSARLRDIFSGELQRPTALFTTQIELVAQLWPVCHERGLEIPRDLSVISCGATGSLSPMTREVDHFRIDFEQIGRIACQQLLSLIGGRTKHLHTLLDVPFRAAGSIASSPHCKPPARRKTLLWSQQNCRMRSVSGKT